MSAYDAILAVIGPDAPLGMDFRARIDLDVRDPIVYIRVKGKTVAIESDGTVSLL